jgi:TPR repeat protein
MLVVSSNCLAYNKFVAEYVTRLIYAGKFDETENYLASASSYLFPDPTASFLLGSFYLGGCVFKRNLKRADVYITKAANLGLPEAIHSLGDGYYSGDIREKNIEKALECYKKAANLGYGPSQFNAGVVLLNTATSKRELKLSIYYLSQAAGNIEDLGEITKDAEHYKANAKDKLRNFK